MISSHLDLPKEEHSNQLRHILTYIKKCYNTELLFDHNDPAVDASEFEQKYWVPSEFGYILRRASRYCVTS